MLCNIQFQHVYWFENATCLDVGVWSVAIVQRAPWVHRWTDPLATKSGYQDVDCPLSGSKGTQPVRQIDQHQWDQIDLNCKHSTLLWNPEILTGAGLSYFPEKGVVTLIRLRLTKCVLFSLENKIVFSSDCISQRGRPSDWLQPPGGLSNIHVSCYVTL